MNESNVRNDAQTGQIHLQLTHWIEQTPFAIEIRMTTTARVSVPEVQVMKTESHLHQGISRPSESRVARLGRTRWQSCVTC